MYAQPAILDYVVPQVAGALHSMYGTTRNRRAPYVRGGRTTRRVNKKYRKKRKKPLTKTKKLSKKISQITRRLDTSQTLLTKRVRRTGTFNVANNQSSLASITVNDAPRMTLVLKTCPFVSSTDTSTIEDVDLTKGTYQREVFFRSIYSNMSMRNNGNTPAKLRVYVVQVKKDTELNAAQASQEGLKDIMSDPQFLSAHVYPSDSELFKDLYRVVKSKSFELKPGGEKSITHSIKNIMYDQSVVENQYVSFQKQLGCYEYLVRMEGVIAHDDGSPKTKVGHIEANVDFSMDTTYSVEYDGGSVGLHRLQIQDDSSLLAPAVIANRPQVAIDTYSERKGDRAILTNTLLETLNAETVQTRNTLSQLIDNLAAILMSNNEYLSDIESDVDDIEENTEESKDLLEEINDKLS